MKISIRKNTFCDYIIAFAIILDCNSVWNNLSWSRSWFQYFIVVILFLGIVVKTINCKGLISNALFISPILILLYFMIFYLLNGNSLLRTTANLMLSCVLLCIYFTAIRHEDNGVSLLIAFKNIVLYIAFFSLFFWLIGSVFKIIQPTNAYLSNWTGNNNQTFINSYFGIYFSYQNISFFDKIYIVRNIAIFNEAPMSSLCFTMGLLIELLCNKNYKRSKCIIFILAILSTFSTAGYIVAAAACVYKYIRGNPQYLSLKILKILLLPTILCVALIIATTLVQEKLSTFSGMARSDDFVSGIKAWLLHPLFGDGIGSLNAMSLVRPSWRRNAEGFNSGLIQVLVQGGLYLTLPYVVAIVNAIRNYLKRRDYGKMIFALLFAFIFILTVIGYSYITIAIIFFLINDSRIKKGGKSDECGDYHIPCSL